MSATTVDKRAAAREPSAARCAAALRFSLEGDLRSLSHHEELRMLKRALSRAGWPLRYSQGFNPQPRLVLPLPRRVGVASACEWAIVELLGAPAPEELYNKLDVALPARCSLGSVACLPSNTMPHPLHVTYSAPLAPAHAAAAGERLSAALNSCTIVVERTHGPAKPTAPIDIRPYIETLILDGSVIVMRLAFHDQRTARPIEVLQALGLPAAEYEHLVRQVEVEWDIALDVPLRWPPGAERTHVGKEEDSGDCEKDRNAKEESRD